MTNDKLSEKSAPKASRRSSDQAPSERKTPKRYSSTSSLPQASSSRVSASPDPNGVKFTEKKPAKIRRASSVQSEPIAPITEKSRPARSRSSNDDAKTVENPTRQRPATMHGVGSAEIPPRRGSKPPKITNSTPNRPLSACIEESEAPVRPARPSKRSSIAPEMQKEPTVLGKDDVQNEDFKIVDLRERQMSETSKKRVQFDDDKIVQHKDHGTSMDWNYKPVAFCCLGQNTWPRSWALAIIRNPWFDRCTMMVIFINCVTLAMYKPCTNEETCGARCDVLGVIDNVIFGYFAAEMLIKMLALGILGAKAYLSDGWNRLDFFIVMAGTVEYALKSVVGDLNLTAIRTIRVLRPLRAVHRIPSLRILVTILMDTLPMLGNVLLLCFFVFFIFGIVGLQLWNGVLRQRCVPGLSNETQGNISVFRDSPFYVPVYPDDSEWICTKPKDNGMHTCQELPPDLDENGKPCTGSIFDDVSSLNGSCYNYNQYYNVCATTDTNPFGGAISFDNMLYSFLSVFVAISMDGWVDIMYATQESHSEWNWIYFVLLVVVGSFYMVNLFLAVIATQFGETKKAETAKMALEMAVIKKHPKEEKGIKGWIKRGKQRMKRIKNGTPDTEPEPELGTAFNELKEIARQPEAILPEKIDDTKAEEPDDIWHTGDGSMREYFNDVIEGYSAVARANAQTSPDSKACAEILALCGARIGTMAVTTRIPEETVVEKKERRETRENKLAVLLPDMPEFAELEFDEEELQKVEDLLKQQMKHKDPLKNAAMEWFEFGHAAQLGAMGKCQESLKRTVDGSCFQKTIMLAIILNTLTMAVEHHNQPDWLTEILAYFNYFFTGLFAVEMGLKLMAYGPRGYVRDTFNIFDGTIVIVSIIELVQGGEGSLSVLRTFRLLRVFKLVRFIPSLRYQLVVMIKCVKNITSFFLLLVLFIFIFTLLGMVLFGGKMCRHTESDGWCSCEDLRLETNDCQCERDNFDDLVHAAITVFMVLTGTYGDMLFAAMESLGPAAAVYFVLLLTFGNYILLNLLVGILLEGFEDTDQDTVLQQLDEEMGLGSIQRVAPHILCSHRTYPVNSVDESPNENPENALTAQISSFVDNRIVPADSHEFSSNSKQVWRDFMNAAWVPNPQLNDSADLPPSSETKVSKTKSWDSKWLWQRFLVEETGYPKPTPYCPYHGTFITYPPPFYTIAVGEDEGMCNCFEPLYEKTCLGSRREHALFLCSAKCFIRRLCIWLVSQRWFDWIVLFFIGLNCIAFAMERPTITDDSFERKFLTMANYVFTGIFTLEMIIKVVAKGFVSGTNAYLKDGWNILDGTLVAVSWVSILFDLYLDAIGSTDDPPPIFGVIRVLRLLRALRPLRVINRAPGLKIVVQTLASSMKPIGSVLLICGLFFLIFSILGVQLYAGQLFFCEGDDLSSVKTKNDCLALNYTWVNQNYNFDNTGNAFILLFVLSTLDNWNELLYTGMDIVGEDMQPQENAAVHNALFYIAFVLLVGFFILNMFVGVVVENFQQNSDQVDKERQAAKEKEKREKQQRRESKKMSKMRVKPPFWTFYGPKRLALYNLVNHRFFDLVIAGIIGLNVLTMSVEFYNQPDELTYVLKIFNYIFTGIFTLEAALKIAAVGVKRYFMDSWNRFDMIVVILSYVGIALEEMKTVAVPINPTIIRVMRVLRITRILKLLKMAKGIQSLMDCVAQALPQVGNLSVLFILMFYIFSALGVELFGKIECSPKHDCQGMGEHVNFKSFPMAFLTLFRVATGDNWNSVMLDTMKTPHLHGCDTSSNCDDNCCVTQGVGPLYFIIFVLLCTFILMNLVVAVLLKYLEEANTKPSDVASPEQAISLAARGIEQDMIERPVSVDESRKSSTVVSQTQDA